MVVHLKMPALKIAKLHLLTLKLYDLLLYLFIRLKLTLRPTIKFFANMIENLEINLT